MIHEIAPQVHGPKPRRKTNAIYFNLGPLSLEDKLKTTAVLYSSYIALINVVLSQIVLIQS